MSALLWIVSRGLHPFSTGTASSCFSLAPLLVCFWDRAAKHRTHLVNNTKLSFLTVFFSANPLEFSRKLSPSLPMLLSYPFQQASPLTEWRTYCNRGGGKGTYQEPVTEYEGKHGVFLERHRRACGLWWSLRRTLGRPSGDRKERLRQRR